MAAVYEAVHRNGKRVAVKMLHSRFALDEDLLRRFRREAYAANSVRHPNVVTIDDDDIHDDGSAFLVMELLQGEGLDARAARCGGRLAADEVCGLTLQLLDALEAAHAKGLIHRDIKPANLFFTPSGQLKVLDFGVARGGGLSEQSNAQTISGALLGTPAFMSPEQARGRRDLIDVRTDLWSVGATMFTLLAGRAVHEGETAGEQLALTMTRPAPCLADFAPDVPIALARLVDRALAFEREARWQTAAEMRAALVALLENRSLTTAEATPATSTPPAIQAASDAETAETLRATVGSRPAEPSKARRRAQLVIPVVLLASLLLFGSTWGLRETAETAPPATTGVSQAQIGLHVRKIPFSPPSSPEQKASGAEPSRADVAPPPAPKPPPRAAPSAANRTHSRNRRSSVSAQSVASASAAPTVVPMDPLDLRH
jgi:serine/threonine-protein kinase